jgi:alkylation response protein AidB-like acyl-CoA dehydrogenase
MSQSAQNDTPEQAEFRQYCQAWLSENRPADPSVRLPLTPLEIMTDEQLTYLQAWQKSAYDAGLIGCDYPVEVGGGGRTDCQRVANGEMIAAKTPYLPNVIGFRVLANPKPVLISPVCRPLPRRRATNGLSMGIKCGHHWLILPSG